MFRLTTLPMRVDAEALVFVVTAEDENLRPIARWRIRWDHPVEAGETVDFYSATPLNTIIRPAGWSVLASPRLRQAGLPTTASPPPTEPFTNPTDPSINTPTAPPTKPLTDSPAMELDATPAT